MLSYKQGPRCTFHRLGRTFWLDRSGEYSKGAFFQVRVGHGELARVYNESQYQRGIFRRLEQGQHGEAAAGASSGS